MSTFISWHDDYSVNIEPIDDQHKKLISFSRDLHKAYLAGVASYIIESILKDLIEFSKYHFDTEEELMRTYGYPDFEDHKKEHENLTTSVIKLLEDYHNNKSEDTILSTLSLLSDWIDSHLLEVDHKYISFFADKEIKITSR